MTRHLDIAGQSGNLYRYKALEDLRPVPPGGANFIYVHWNGDAPVIVYAGETDSLHRSVFETWDEAQSGFGATEIFARLNITGVVRREEHADIVGQHQPPMNSGDVNPTSRRKASPRVV